MTLPRPRPEHHQWDGYSLACKFRGRPHSMHVGREQNSEKWKGHAENKGKGAVPPIILIFH